MNMKKRFFPLTVAAFAAIGSSLLAPALLNAGSSPLGNTGQEESLTQKAMEEYGRHYANLMLVEQHRPYDEKLVQIALLLDTSNSMDGLINQAKSQLWRIVNELSRAHKRGNDIRLEVALYEYGNDRLAMTAGYIRQVTPFTEDLDWLSEALFSLQTNGGSEYCGHVIGSSLNQLGWNRSGDGLKMIFIAGNEPFNQGSVNYEVSCRWAVEREIVVNTIYCGPYQRGIDTLWQQGANKGGGSYFAIDSDKVLKGIVTPYDDDLLTLNSAINSTYIPYGSKGEQNLSRQAEQDMNASKLSPSISAARAASKGSKLYKASDWDLVDALEEKKISIENISRDALPKELQEMRPENLGQFVQQKKEEREEIRQKIAALSRKRDDYIQKKEHESAGEQTLGSAILKTLHTQAEAKNFRFE